MANKLEEKNYYEILGVDETASKEQIKKAYKEMALIYHPDSNFFNEILGEKDNSKKAEEDFQIITNAFNVLTDDEKRKEYNDTIAHFKDWGDGESLDEYFDTMIIEKRKNFKIHNTTRERSNTTIKHVYTENSSNENDLECKNKGNSSNNTFNFKDIINIRFSNKLDLLTILTISLALATIILYFLSK